MNRYKHACIRNFVVFLFVGTSTLPDSTTASAESKYPLQECMFDGDLTDFIALLKSNDIDEKDKHGNTALHLAVMMGKREFVDLLLERNASVNISNLLGWTPLSEAISYGDRQTIQSLWIKSKQQTNDKMKHMRPHLLAALKNMDDFYMEIKWNFSSWIPLLSRNFPSDLCKIQKRGSSVRFDSTIAHFNGLKWKRGDVTFLFDSEAPPDESLFILDNEGLVYQKLGREETEVEIENQVDKLMTSEISQMDLNTKTAKFYRARSGYFFAPKDKTEMVGPYEADYYDVDGLILETRNRREHLSERDIRRKEKIEESLNNGHWPKTDSRSRDSCSTEGNSRLSLSHENQSRGNRSRWSLSLENLSRWSLSRESHENKIQPTVPKTSLNPPPPCSINWKTYVDSEPGRYPNIGRPMMLNESRKNYRATVAMSPKFPLSVEMLMKVLEAIAPLMPKQMINLKEFLQMELPSGFPVKLDIPAFPFVTANVTFQEFQILKDADETKFRIPSNYKIDPKRFPDL